MFLHIHYGAHDKKNRVMPLDFLNISIQEEPGKLLPRMRVLYDNKKISFRMKIEDITFITNDNDGKLHLSVEGCDSKNRKVKVYTDNNRKRYVNESEVAPDLFIKSDMADAFNDFTYREI